ncbi:MAG: winged helix-turn-helix transcriptional regulator [Spirochaetes bacterium]|nr:winged helix-turn-helix transcriptional regulator [Spirochaetota bacterium]
MTKLFKDNNEFIKQLKEPEDQPAFMLWQASTIWMRLIRRDMKEFNATYTQFIILCSLIYLSKNNKHVNQRLIAQHSKLDVMTVSDVLKTLVSKKLVIRTVNEKDKRHNFLKITDKGTKLAQNIFCKVRETDQKFFGSLGDKENEFNNLLIKLTNANFDDLYNANE